ncbi:MAG TPA: low molecular weight phosphatase family protein [Clostridiales bacterium]|nr:low molecular weight phosphatase family protein [Clostridiales bacterium]
MYKVLFVCSQNMCRSPYCDYLFQKMTEEDPVLNGKVEVHSSAVMTPGTKLDPLTAKALLRDGVDRETVEKHRPGYLYRKKDWKYFKEADIIICMTRSHYFWTPVIFWKKMKTLTEVAEGVYRPVPDPWLIRDETKYFAQMDIIKHYLEEYKEKLKAQLS